MPGKRICDAPKRVPASARVAGWPRENMSERCAVLPAARTADALEQQVAQFATALKRASAVPVPGVSSRRAGIWQPE